MSLPVAFHWLELSSDLITREKGNTMSGEKRRKADMGER